jgi:hypothetical protein
MDDRQCDDRRRHNEVHSQSRRAVKRPASHRVVLSLSGAAAVISLAFVACSSEAITGPSAPSSQLLPASPLMEATVTKVDVAPENIPPLENIPAFIEPVSCSGDVIVWDPERSHMNVTGTSVANDNGYRLELHINMAAQGVGAVSLTKPQRTYVGSNEYDQQYQVKANEDDSRVRTQAEFDLEIIAKGEDRLTRYTGDDFVVHYIFEFDLDPTVPAVVPVELKGFAKCQ